MTQTLYEQGKTLLSQGRYDEALSAFDQLSALSPNDPRVHYQRGLTLYELGDAKASISAHRTALKFAPNNPDLHNAIANGYFALGNREKAQSHYEKALENGPAHSYALSNLVHMNRYPLNAPVIKTLLELHASPIIGRDRALVCFALAEAHEKLGESDKAFSYYEEANKSAFGTYDYKVEKDAALMQDIARNFSAEFFARAPKGSDDTTPIFILGMPRSGTTLIEQILASHSQVKGAGETNAMAAIAFQSIPKRTGLPFPQGMEKLTEKDLSELAGEYLTTIKKRAGDAEHICVKLPTDFLMVGLIHLLFPHAAIIHTKRDAMDTCWSLYKHYFQQHPYCYDQAALGGFYKAYAELMTHWHAVLPGRIHDVEYERMVEDTESEIQKLLAHCNLEWEKNCLHFHRSDRAVATASALQVRKPIYKTSVKSWEKMADKLEPLKRALGRSS